MLLRILSAAAILIVLAFVPTEGVVRFCGYMAAYLIVGWNILKKAGKGILKGYVLYDADNPQTVNIATTRAAVLDAVPPTWNVRRVSCVPGSPMDCAAMTPTTSPFSTMRPDARLRP